MNSSCVLGVVIAKSLLVALEKLDDLYICVYTWVHVRICKYV